MVNNNLTVHHLGLYQYVCQCVTFSLRRFSSSSAIIGQHYTYLGLHSMTKIFATIFQPKSASGALWIGSL